MIFLQMEIACLTIEEDEVMQKLDLDRFWEKDRLAHMDNCFSSDSPQVALGIRMSDECVFAELGVDGNPWGPIDRELRMELNRRYNDKAEKIVGIRLLNEYVPHPDECFPAIRRIGEVFGGQYIFNGVSEWLTQSCHTPQELEKMLDRVERMDLREFILPSGWEKEKKRIFEQYGKKPSRFIVIRGPVSLACSIFGVENLIFLIMDEPDLAKRFSNAIRDVTLQYAYIMAEEAGYTRETMPHGFHFNDDDCCLLNEELYTAFAYPILKAVFDELSPDEGDIRYQHSDSNMEHLLPVLGKLNLNGVNFGPTVMIDRIRHYLPKARIEGQLAPFTFMRNDAEAITNEVKRDCMLAKQCGRGVCLTTAGSINNGSLLTSMYTVMCAIDRYGQYGE